MKSTLVSIGSVSTLVVTSNTDRKKLLIKNNGPNECYIGNDIYVTVNNGFPVFTNETFDCSSYLGSYYGVRATGSVCSIIYIEEV